jgi:hypothetical protein
LLSYIDMADSTSCGRTGRLESFQSNLLGGYR